VVRRAVCCSECCSEEQCVAVSVAAKSSVLQWVLQRRAVCCSECCSEEQYVAVYKEVIHTWNQRIRTYCTFAHSVHSVFNTHVYDSMCVCALYTGWRRPITCLELQVIFRKRATNYRALLPKITYQDKASYDSSPPCTHFWVLLCVFVYGVATISRLLKITGLFCKRAL